MAGGERGWKGELAGGRAERGGEQELLKVKFSGSANDADRDEVEEVTKKLGEVRHVMHVKKNKLAAAEALVIKARSRFRQSSTLHVLD